MCFYSNVDHSFGSDVMGSIFAGWAARHVFEGTPKVMLSCYRSRMKSNSAVRDLDAASSPTGQEFKNLRGWGRL